MILSLNLKGKLSLYRYGSFLRSVDSIRTEWPIWPLSRKIEKVIVSSRIQLWDVHKLDKNLTYFFVVRNLAQICTNTTLWKDLGNFFGSLSLKLQDKGKNAENHWIVSCNSFLWINKYLHVDLLILEMFFCKIENDNIRNFWMSDL